MNLLFLLFPFLSSTGAPVDAPTLPSADATAPPAVERPAPSLPVSCELRQIKRGDEQVVLAVIRANVAIEGEYEFSLDAKDAHHSTVSTNDGDAFRIGAGERKDLTGPSLNLGRGSTLKGRLDLRDVSGRLITSCTL